MGSRRGAIHVVSAEATIQRRSHGDVMAPVKPKQVKRKKHPFKRGRPHKNKADKRAKENHHPDYTKED
jgi:hypothetical protein